MPVLYLFLFLLLCLGSYFSLTDPRDRAIEKYIDQYHLDLPHKVNHKLSGDEQLKDLGGDLFYSPDLSAFEAVSCASCHHPEKAGADGLALPIGVTGGVSTNIGEQRLNASKELYGEDGLLGLIPRNSPTVFNSALFQQVLFWDGRVQTVSEESEQVKIKVGFGISELSPVYYQQNSLLQAQARLPLSSPFEMKGVAPSFKNDHEIEKEVIDNLRRIPYWCKRFEGVYKGEDCSQNITIDNLTKALAEYQASLIFIDSPFERYIKGDKSALSDIEKQGAIDFFTPLSEGGLGCVGCHKGKNFSNEGFYDLAVPSSGIGVNDDGIDYGRSNVDKAEKTKAFRVPSLLNVEVTAPYFHNGVVSELEGAVLHHGLKNRSQVGYQVLEVGRVNYSSLYSKQLESFEENKAIQSLLPESINAEKLKGVVLFLKSLTDECVKDAACMRELVREPISYVKHRPVLEQKTEMDIGGAIFKSLKVKPPVISCEEYPSSVSEKPINSLFTINNMFENINYSREIGLVRRGSFMDVINYAGMSSVDVNHDCLDDLVIDFGTNGIHYFEQQLGGGFVEAPLSFKQNPDQLFPMVLDVDGDYKFDLIVGSLGVHPAYVVFDFLNNDEAVTLDALFGPVVNVSAADIDNDGDLDLAFAFWRTFQTVAQDHVWKNDGKGGLSAMENNLAMRRKATVKFSGEGAKVRNYHVPVGKQDLTFTPNFADIDNDGDQDLLLAADFHRSQVFENRNGELIDITNKAVISDSNGMGATVADFNNDGFQDWFVTSIYNSQEKGLNGHRLYTNTGNNGQYSAQTIKPDIDEWSWAACAADFNNDGYMDIFYVSGFGEFLTTALFETDLQEILAKNYMKDFSGYAKSVPALLLNDGSGGFTNSSMQSGLTEVINGRGLVCFDYQRDGDIDAVIMPLEGKPVLVENNLNGRQNWIQVKVIGKLGNTEAFGASVELEAASGKQYRQVRHENNYVSRNPATLHFGLGDEARVRKLVIKNSGDDKDIILLKPEINKVHVVYLSN